VDDPRALAYLAVGSNIEPELNVPSALEMLARTPGVTLTGISTFYRTPALSGPEAGPGKEARREAPGREVPPTDYAGPRRRDDPDFLNGVLEVRTTLSPERMQEVLRGVEERLGRVRVADRYAPRTMDVDLLLYAANRGIDGTYSLIPVRTGGASAHPDVRTRPFVALPLMELAPDLLLPPDGTSIKAVAEGFPGSCGIPEVRFTENLRSRFLPV
jgi:2-amino-4-hydroxy-6-hydroxymethyldihydropteridine diphosphokinase